MIDGHRSSPKPVLSGVPQGSVLGPLFFLVLIGDIDKEVVEAFLSSFADDTRVGKGISTPADTAKLQSDLNAVYNWSVINNMLFNSDKFELVRYESKASKLTQAETSYYSNDGSQINETTHVRDLGVTLSNAPPSISISQTDVSLSKEKLHGFCELSTPETAFPCSHFGKLLYCAI